MKGDWKMKNKINKRLSNYKLLKLNVMKIFYKLLIVMLSLVITTNVTAQLTGAYKLAPEAGAMGVGPGQGDMSWWSNSVGDLDLRACFFDDIYLFNEDGTFENILQDETWVETWQGATEDGCATPVAPHDGTGNYTFSYDEGAGTVTINGVGGFLGLSKVYNGGELTSPGDAPESITYMIDIQEGGDLLIIDIEVAGGGWWRFKMVPSSYTPPTGSFEGMWQMAPIAGAMGVGPAQGDMSWWSNSVDDITLRGCFFDDYYVFNGDGSFENILQDETWIEEWQGATVAECGTPVAPHDGTAVATWSYDEGAGTVTVDGTGAYLGIPKAVNGAELGSPGDAPESVTYLVSFEDDGETMVLDIDVTGAWWRFKLAYTGPVGISEIGNTSLNIFPNPAQDYISVSEEFNSLKIYNVSGSLVMDIQQNQNQINVSDLSSGVYFIQMNTTDGQLKQSKFLKK